MPSNPGGLVYGTILVATLLAAESAKHESYGETVAAIAIALSLYWLANAYADYAGERAQDGEHFTVGGYMRALVHEFAVVVGALGPLVAVLACWATGARLDTAIFVGVYVAGGIIVATELLLGIRSHLDGRELIVQTAFGVIFGAAVVALRVLLH